MTTKKKEYPQAFKDEAVQLLTKQGYTPQDAAEAVGVPVAYIQKWKKIHDKQESGLILEGSEREELIQLRKDIKRLKMEQDILKKAAAFFAKEMK